MESSPASLILYTCQFLGVVAPLYPDHDPMLAATRTVFSVVHLIFLCPCPYPAEATSAVDAYASEDYSHWWGVPCHVFYDLAKAAFWWVTWRWRAGRSYAGGNLPCP